MKKQLDMKERVLGPLSAVGVVVASAVALIFGLYVLTILVRLLLSGVAA